MTTSVKLERYKKTTTTLFEQIYSETIMFTYYGFELQALSTTKIITKSNLSKQEILNGEDRYSVEYRVRRKSLLTSIQWLLIKENMVQ